MRRVQLWAFWAEEEVLFLYEANNSNGLIYGRGLEVVFPGPMDMKKSTAYEDEVVNVHRDRGMARVIGKCARKRLSQRCDKQISDQLAGKPGYVRQPATFGPPSQELWHISGELLNQLRKVLATRP